MKNFDYKVSLVFHYTTFFHLLIILLQESFLHGGFVGKMNERKDVCMIKSSISSNGKCIKNAKL